MPDDSSNPSREARKQTRDRIRVSRACDRCKQKKSRCSGQRPCNQCMRHGLLCEYNAPYSRGRIPSVALDRPASDPALRSDIGSVPPVQGISSNSPRSTFVSDTMVGMTAPQRSIPPSSVSTTDQPQRLPEHLESPSPNRENLSSQSMRNSPEVYAGQTDLQGHYVGPSSGVSFLRRALKRLHQVISLTPNSSMFTFGDSPLPASSDPSFFVLPPKSDAQILVARYFDFALPTHRFLHQPTVEIWLNELYDNFGYIPQKAGTREKQAVLFMVFAQAKEYMPPGREAEIIDSSSRYFQAAEQQLRAETGEIRLTSVQARLCQCYYLLSQSRINHCWSLFGTTTQLIFAIGLHRKQRPNISGRATDYVDLECRKRVFWCAYSLDNYLSAALGRPRTFHASDIDQELPSCIDDCDITTRAINSTASSVQTIMLAPVYHAKLSQIISGTLKDLYSIHPAKPELRLDFAKKYTDDLAEWRRGISHFLDEPTSYMTPLFRRQNTVLNLAYWHALILIHRPFLLSDFASLEKRHPRFGGDMMEDATEESIALCLEAAMNVVRIIDALSKAKQMYRTFWFTHYYAFCSIVIIYVHTIQYGSGPPDLWREHFSAAEECQMQISAFAGGDSFAKRCGVVLEELRLEATKRTQEKRTNMSTGLSNTHSQFRTEIHPPSHVTERSSTHQPANTDIHIQTAYPNMVAPSPPLSSDAFSFSNDLAGDGSDSLMAAMTTWGDFDSLVSAGFGGLEDLFGK